MWGSGATMKAQIPFSPLNSFIHLFVPIPPSLLPTSLCPEPAYIIVMSALRQRGSNCFASDRRYQPQILQPVADQKKNSRSRGRSETTTERQIIAKATDENLNYLNYLGGYKKK